MAYSDNQLPNGLDAKATPVDADVVVVGDSADSNRAKKTTIAQLRTLIEAFTSYFNVSSDTLDDITAGTTNKHFTSTDETKLDGIETGADVTDTTNVTAAGALMDSECTSLADVKALDQSVVSGASPTFSTTNMTDAANKRFMSDAQETKLDSVESSADVTDEANVTDALDGATLVDLGTPASTDRILLQDDSDSGVLKTADFSEFGGTGGISNIVEDTSPQLGGQLDVNGNAIGDGTRELLTFTEDASAVNHINIENEATGSGPIIRAAGDDTNVDLKVDAKGTGTVFVDGLAFKDGNMGNGSDGFTVLQFGNLSGNVVYDNGSNEIIGLDGVSSAVNYNKFVSAATGNGPEIQAVGGDTNIDIELVPKGTGDVLANSNRVLDVTDTSSINFIIDGGGSAITTGVKGYIEIPFACTINQVTLLADQSGSIVVDIWKDTYANYPPTDADSITASAVPTILSATKSQDATLTGWTTSVSAGDILGFNVDSASTVERVTLALKVTRT